VLFTTTKNTGRPEMAESGDVFGHIILMKNDAFVSFWIWFAKFEYSNLELSQKSFANNESRSFCNIKKHW
jgi:hypothetical protein